MASSTRHIERPWPAVEVGNSDDDSTTEMAHQHVCSWATAVAIGAPLALFPLAALSQMLLIRGRTGYAAGLCRFAMFVFGVSYVAFDTAAGLVTGVLVRAAYASNAPEQWRGPLLAIWTHAVIGGSSDGAPLLAVLGTTAWLTGSLLAAFIVRRAGSSWLPVVCLGVSALGLSVFRTHAWPGGPVTFGSLALAAALIEIERCFGA